MTAPRLAARLNRRCVALRPRISSGFVKSASLALQRRSVADRRGFGSSASRLAPGLSGLKDVIRISAEVADAVATNKPVVALESTIYTHGAFVEDLGLEDIVRDLGAVPAVCGVYDGVATVGLEKHEIQGMVHGGSTKVSRRDLAVIVGDGLRGVRRHGGTTIAGTMILARAAGIRVFGTGGLGGVHRGAETTMDISADLTELGRTRVAVVSAGCKGFLDIPRTLEYLETQGVVVSTFASTREPNAKVPFPAFWARDSGVKSPSHFQNPKDAAYMIYAQEKLGIESGLLLANPIPEEAAIPREVMEDAISRAVQDAEQQGFTGSNNTPFILQRIREYTGGRSVKANLALVRSNVALAARIARSLSEILKDGPSALNSPDEKPIPSSSFVRVPDEATSLASTSHVKVESAQGSTGKPTTEIRQEPTSQGALDEERDRRYDIVVAGGVALDLSCDYSDTGTPKMYTSNPAKISQSVGGVGHNVALAAHRFGAGDVRVKLCSVVGDDVAGTTVVEGVRASGLSTSGIRKVTAKEHSGARTAQYVSVNDSSKSLVLAMADMDLISAYEYPKQHWKRTLAEARPKCLVVDANLDARTIQSVLAVARHAKAIFEPVSVAKSVRLFQGPKRLGVYPNQLVDLASPNIYELSAMFDAAQERGYFHDAPDWMEVIDRFNMSSGGGADYRASFERMLGRTSDEVNAAGLPQKMLHLLPYIPSIVVKLGDQGCLLAEIMGPNDRRLLRPSNPSGLASYVRHQKSVLTRAAPGGTNGEIGGLYMRYYPPAEKVRDVVSVNGVGDTFLGVLTAGLARGVAVHKMMGVAQMAAVMTLRSAEAVSPDLGRLRRRTARQTESSLRRLDGRRSAPTEKGETGAEGPGKLRDTVLKGLVVEMPQVKSTVTDLDEGHAATDVARKQDTQADIEVSPAAAELNEGNPALGRC